MMYFIVPIGCAVAIFLCFMFARKCQKDCDIFAMKVLIFLAFSIAIMCCVWITNKSVEAENEAREELICTITEKAKTYSVYVNGIEVPFENIHIEDYLSDVFIDDENQKILIAAK